MDEQAHAVGRALVACLRSDASSPEESERLADVLSRSDQASLVDGARAHRVSTLVLESLRASGADLPALEAALVEDQRSLVSSQLRIALDLTTVGHVLDGAGVPWLVFKGPVLAQVAYPRPDRRRYDDLDVITPPAAFPDAVRALEAAGFLVMDQNWDLIRREGRGQLHLTHPGGGLVDLHWHLLNRATVRRSFSVDVVDIFERARVLELNGQDVHTLDVTDTLVHTCLHAALSGAGRLSWVKDVDGLVTRWTGDWDEVEARARSWRAASAVALMLARSRRILGSDTSGELPLLAMSRTRTRVDRFIDRRWPLEATALELSPATLWAEVQRDGAARLAAAAIRRIARRPIALAHGRPSTSGAVMVPTGTQRDRETFFRDVERMAAV